MVQPLTDESGAHLAAITGAATLDELQAVWKAITAAGLGAQFVKAKDARKAELSKPVDEASPDYVAPQEEVQA